MATMQDDLELSDGDDNNNDLSMDHVDIFEHAETRL